LLDVDRHLLENAGRQGQVEDAVRLVLVLHQLQLLVEQLEASASIVAAGEVGALTNHGRGLERLYDEVQGGVILICGHTL